MSEGGYIGPAHELNNLGEYKILDYYNLRPYVGKEIPKPVYVEGYEPKEDTEYKD
ncbi:MAG: hypothetical protein GX362_00875 [Methanosarcinaceae archaeon]|nr:hypothetical protein [Methanosarcinaceae archaeon]